MTDAVVLIKSGIRFFFFAAILAGISALMQLGCGEDKSPSKSTIPPESLWTFTLVSGDSQAVRPYDTLSNRLVACLKDGKGEPIPSQAVTFELRRGNAEVFAKLSPADVAEVRTVTDFNGNTAASLRYFVYVTGDTCQVKAYVDADTTLAVFFTIFVSP